MGFGTAINFYDLTNGAALVRSWPSAPLALLPYSPNGAGLLQRSGSDNTSTFRYLNAFTGGLLAEIAPRTLTAGGGYSPSVLWIDDTHFITPALDSPDGPGMNYAYIDLFNVETQTRSELFHTDFRVVSAHLALSPDQQTIAMGGWGQGGTGGVNYLRFYDQATGAESGREEGHGSPVANVSFSPDGRSIVSAGADNSIRIWDRLSGALLRVIVADYPVYRALFSPNGKYLAASYGFFGGGSGQVAAQTWKASDFSLPPVTLGGARDIAFTSDSQYTVSAETDGVVRIRQVSNGSLVASKGLVDLSVVACSPTSPVVAVNSGGYIFLLDLPSTDRLWFGTLGYVPTSAAFTPDGSKLLVAGNGSITAIKVSGATSSILWSKTLPNMINFRLGIEPCGKYVVTGMAATDQVAKGKVVILRMSDGEVVKTYDEETGERQFYTVLGAGWSPDGEAIAYTRWDGQVVAAKNPFYAPPKLSAVSASPATLAGGAKATGSVTLDCPAPVVVGDQYVDGAVVALSSSDPSLVQVPPSVTVPGPMMKSTFPFTTSGVAVTTTVTITAKYNNVTKTKVITLNPPALSKVAVSPTSVIGGVGSTGTVTLTGSPAVGTGGVVVSLSSNNVAAGVPASVTVPEGAISATFAIDTTGVAALTVATVTATYNGVSKTANLTVKPPALSSLKLSPTSVKGGVGTSTGTVTLTGIAPAAGFTVTLASANTLIAQVPASVVVQAGQRTAILTVSTTAVAVKTGVVITASAGTVSKSATLTVTP